MTSTPKFVSAVVAIACVILAVPASTLSAQCTPPAGYYAGVNTSSPALLRQTLHAAIEHHTRVPDSQTWAVLEKADEDPANRGRILDIYKNVSYPKNGGGGGGYNREHVWPRSYGFPSSGVNNYPDTDCHALFLSDTNYNSARSNKPFKNCQSGCNEFAVNGGGSGAYPGSSNWEKDVAGLRTWETWIGRRGDVARAMFYMDVRYDGSPHIFAAAEPDLVLTDCQSLIQTTGGNASVAYMGYLSVLLQWHQEDPVDAKECARNEAVFAAQGNRNPFIDHPEWVYRLYAGNGTDQRTIWINELHYDNNGTDQNEMVEIAGPAGFDLCGYRVAGYNGNGGAVYKTLYLSGTLPGQPGCVGTLAFDFKSMQNGAPDGLALIDPRNRVVEFLSYEGTLVATSGAAIGMTSVDIGVSESGSTPAWHSLQLGGTGMRRADFSWQAAQTNTRGTSNAGQTFVGGCGEPRLYGCGHNPYASMVLISGVPSLGETVTLGLDNPLGTQAPGSAASLLLAASPQAAYPCGFRIPGFGMRGPGVPGELLIGLSGVVTVPASTWSGPGAPASVAVTIPPAAGIIGASVYTQGVILDLAGAQGVAIGLTDGMQLLIGQ